MRPLSPSDPNSPYRASTPVLIDFFAKEVAEQEERANANRPHSPFAELSPRGMSTSNRSDSAVDAGTLSASPVTVSSIRNFLRSKGHSKGQRINDDTVQSRLDALNLSAETLFEALKIIHTPDHPLLITLRVSATERISVTTKLKGILNHSSGFQAERIYAAQQSNNNPNQLIRNFLQLVR